MKYAFQICTAMICTFGRLCGNDSPHWHLDSTDMGWKDEFLAMKYFHNSELQRQWAWHLLGSNKIIGNEQILDFGCGDGKISAEISHFVPLGHVTGVDVSPSMIAFAKRCFPTTHYPNVTFNTAKDIDFTNESVLKKYDLICSFCVFHLVANPVQVLNNLRLQLADNGKLLLVIPCGNNPAFFQAAHETFEKYKLTAPWNTANTNTNGITMRTRDGCITCLEAAGLVSISIKLIHTPTAFFNKQELVEWMMGTVTPNWQIPLEKADSFFNDLIDRMAELDDDVIHPSGAYYMKLSRFEVAAVSK